MTKLEFLKLMQFPIEWAEWDMYPDRLFDLQVSGYKPGHEAGAEHDRNGAFHWWMKREPDKAQIRKLFQLTYLDPDQPLAKDVRNRLRGLRNYESEIEQGNGPT